MATPKKVNDPIVVKDISADYQATWNKNVEAKAKAAGQTNIGYDSAGNLHRASTAERLNEIINAYNADYTNKLKTQVSDLGNQVAELGTKADQMYQQGLDEGRNDMKSYVDQAIAPYLQAQAQQNQAYANAQKANAQTINANRDMSAREYYQLYKTMEKELPENLSKAGVTGGASESASIKLMNDYANNIFKNENARNAELNGADAKYNEQVAQNSVQMANTLANQMYQTARDEIAYQRDEKRYQDELERENAAIALEQEQAKAKAQTLAEINKENIRQRELEAKKQQEGYTTKGYTDNQGYYRWNVTGKKKVASTSTKSSGTGSKPSGNNNDYKYVEDKPKTIDFDRILNSPVASGTLTDARSILSKQGKYAAITYIEKQKNNKSITESEAEEIARRLEL